jgi:hypothetical protein
MKFLSERCWDSPVPLVNKLYTFKSHCYTWEARAYLGGGGGGEEEWLVLPGWPSPRGSKINIINKTVNVVLKNFKLLRKNERKFNK